MTFSNESLKMTNRNDFVVKKMTLWSIVVVRDQMWSDNDFVVNHKVFVVNHKVIVVNHKVIVVNSKRQ